MQIVCAPRKAGRSTPMTGTDRSNFCSRTIVSCFVLFFQAEDGIRDLTVTGVQTCALPILTAFGLKHTGASLAAYASALGQELTEEWKRLGLVSVLEILISGIENGDVRFWFVRSEERSCRERV